MAHYRYLEKSIIVEVQESEDALWDLFKGEDAFSAKVEHSVEVSKRSEGGFSRKESIEKINKYGLAENS